MLDAYDKTHGFANFPLMPGDIKYKDIADVNGNTDNVINTNDRVATLRCRKSSMDLALLLNSRIWISRFSFKERLVRH